MRFLAVALATLLLVTGCGDGGSSVAPTGPAPRLPLTWTDIPESVTVGRGETVTFTATLSAAVDAVVAITTDDPKVEVSGELIRPGVFRGTLTGVGYGDVAVSLVATEPGYDRADAVIAVFVDGVLNLQIWRQMVFGEFSCPRRECDPSGLSVEERTIQVRPFSPNFRLVAQPSERSAADGVYRLADSERRAVEGAIRDAIEQLTGEPFAAEIISSGEPRRQEGWVDVVFANDAWIEARARYNEGGRLCLFAPISGSEIAINVGCFRADGFFRLGTMVGVARSLGFFQHSVPGDHMLGRVLGLVEDFSDDEQFHARLAHKLGHGAPYSADPLSLVESRAQSRVPAEALREHFISRLSH